MGNLDLVIIINNSPFIIKGEQYETKTGAINLAIERFEEFQREIDRNRHDPKTGELYPAADENWFPEEVETIRIYVL